MTAEDLPTITLQATREFAKRIASVYPSKQTILFGSRARGTAHDESDADVAVVLAGEAGDFIRTKMAMNDTAYDIAYDILLSTGIRIQPLPVWESEWAEPEHYSNSYLLQNIMREGIWL